MTHYGRSLPTHIHHADWGRAPDKRWVASAIQHDGGYVIGAPRPAPSGVAWLMPDRGTSLLGVDFVLGLPAAYVQARQAVDAAFANATGFVDWLRCQAASEPSFFDVAEHADQISLRRPFYPARAGGSARANLVHGLGLGSASDLYRVCDMGTAGQPAAAPMFWTMGAQQVGKATLAGWCDLVLPLFDVLGDKLALWPFDGALHALLEGQYRLVVVETWPRLLFAPLGLPDVSKAASTGRAELAERLCDWGRKRPWMQWSDDAEAALRDGFEDRSSGRDDALDAVIGVVGMTATVMGEEGFGEGVSAASAWPEWEGWILGRAET